MGQATNGSSILRCIYNFLALSDNYHWKFRRILSYHTRSWQSEKVGTIRFIFPAGRKLNLPLANKLDAANKNIAGKFGNRKITVSNSTGFDATARFRWRNVKYRNLFVVGKFLAF